MKLLVILSSITAFVGAVPAYPKQCPAIPQTANFDDLAPALPGAPLTPLPSPYKELYYQGISFITSLNPLGMVRLPGVQPHSGKNYGTIAVGSQREGTPMLTTNYPDSKVKSFRLKSFYYGCVLQLENGLTAIPNDCTVHVTGYTGKDNTVASSRQVCSQDFSYDVSTAFGLQQQTEGIFDDCAGKDLQFAEIRFSFPGGQSALQPLAALLIDDIKYSTKAKYCYFEGPVEGPTEGKDEGKDEGKKEDQKES